MQNLDTKGIVFDIQRFSVHDGPGIRTIVFLKGCPLKCSWCSNPESQNLDKQIMFIEKNCIECGKCVEACQKDALQIKPNFHVDYEKCDLCGDCVDACYSKALHMSGNYYTIEEVINELDKDSIHYRRSGGGITLSGGEPLFQHEYALKLLKACKEKGWHTAIETTAMTNKSVLEKILPWIDLVLLDIKHIDNEKHVKYTGYGNETVLTNAQFIGQFGVPIVVRIPIVPSFNDEPREVEAIASFAKSIQGVKAVHLLPYHRLGENKYEYLNYNYEMKTLLPPSKEKLGILLEVVTTKGLQCQIGG